MSIPSDEKMAVVETELTIEELDPVKERRLLLKLDCMLVPVIMVRVTSTPTFYVCIIPFAADRYS